MKKYISENGDLTFFSRGVGLLLWRVAQSLAAASTVLFLTHAVEPQIVSLVVFLLMFWLLQHGAAAQNRRVRLVAGVFALFFAGSCVLAEYAYLERVYGGFFCADTVWVLLKAWVFFFALLRMLYGRLQTARIRTVRRQRLTSVQVFLLCFAGLLAVYAVCFLCHFPGNIMADTRTQLVQMAGLEPYANHHPVAHTLAMQVFFDLGLSLFGTQNAGVALVTLSQSLAVAAVFAYAISTMHRFGVRPVLLVCAMLFFAFAPNNLLFSITPVKDIPFAIMAVLLATVLWRLLDGLGRGESVQRQWLAWTLLPISSLGLCVLRTNGVYAFIPFLALCAVFLKGKRLLTLPVMGGALLLALVFRGPVLNALAVPPPDTVEALSLPVQHISRVIADGKALTEAEYELLCQVVAVEAIPAAYESYTSDPIKALVRKTGNQSYIGEHKMEFLSLWVRLGLRYPKEYLYAQIDETVGFWYPNVQYESLYLGGIHPESTRLNIATEPKLTGLAPRLLYRYLTGTRDFAVFALIFSIGTATWLAVALFGMAIVNRRRAALLPYLFVFLVLGTLLAATPVHAEFRYLYALFALLPQLAALPFRTGAD